MAVIVANDLQMEFKGEAIFSHLSFQVNEKDRVAIVGPNGSGKTTLLKIILNQYIPSQGNITLGSKINIGYLSQDVISSEKNTLLDEAMLVYEKVIKDEKELQELEQKVSQNPNDTKLMDEYGKKQIIFANEDGYNYHYIVEMMLSKFGFRKEDFNRPINSFSGGEKTKMAFVKLLLIKPKLLILDEPTNHLDIITIEWLEDYLKSYDGTLIFVSHDRYFINALANRIFELEDGKLDVYRGNYDYYIEEKKIRYEQALKAYNMQQKEIAKIKRFIEFYMPKPRFVSRAHDREKKLAHIKVLDKPKTEEKAINISFGGEALKGKKCIEFINLSLGYDHPLVKDINFTLWGQDKVAIMGNNGAGKTTLLKAILHQLRPLDGEIKFYRELNIGYIDQHHFDISGPQTIVQDILDEFPEMGEKAIFNYLGSFNFSYDDCLKSLDVLSGGEKMRVLLAKVILRKYDLLLLDEPTNHLDMVTKQALTIALRKYQGSIIFVSHDRYFVDEIANRVIYFYNGKTIVTDGNYQDFKEKEQSLFAPLEEEKVEKKVDTRQKNKPQNISLGKLENKIAVLEKQIKEIKAKQFLEENYMDAKKMKELDAELAEKNKTLESLEEEYLLRMDN